MINWEEHKKKFKELSEAGGVTIRDYCDLNGLQYSTALRYLSETSPTLRPDVTAIQLGDKSAASAISAISDISDKLKTIDASEESVKEEFERWWARNSFKSGTLFSSRRTKMLCFRVWIGSREAIEISLPSSSEYDDRDVSGAHSAINDCKTAIEAVGLSVK